MSRPTQPPRLYLRERKGRAPTWVIKHLGQETSLGLAGTQHTEATAELARFTAALKTKNEGGEKHAAKLHIETVLTYYLEKHVPQLARPRENTARIENLAAFFGQRSVAQICGALCREFVEWRRADGCGDSAARRELVTLRAAIGFWHAEYTLDVVPCVTLPKEAAPRGDYLTRDEVARLLWAAWKGNAETGVQPNKHIARFILIGVYTGTRTSAILGLRWLPSLANGWVDLDRGLLHRKGNGIAASKKRQPTVQLHKRLAVHMARWRRMDLAAGVTSVVSYNGKPVGKLRAWAKVREASGLTTERGALFNPVKHHLRHTATTWLLQAGVAIWEVAGYVGMSPEILDKVYGHHSPDRQHNAASMGYGSSRQRAA